MKRHLITLILMGLVLMFLSSCICDDDDKPSDPLGKGKYYLKVQQTEIKSYPGGGGLFIISLKPGDDFEGTVKLSTLADPSLHAHLTTGRLTSDKRVAEIEIHPATTTAIKEYTIKVESQNEDTSYSLTLKANVVKADSGVIDDRYPKTLFNEFVQYIQDSQPELSISTDMDWIKYTHYPVVMAGTPCKWSFLCHTWDITVFARSGPTWPTWYLLRKRGEYDPHLAAYKDINVSIHEIPVNDFGEDQ